LADWRYVMKKIFPLIFILNSRIVHEFSMQRLAVVIAAIFALLAVSCATPPPVDTIVHLIQVHETNCVFHVLDVEEVGPFHKQGRYWPVKVRMKGACDAGFRTVQVDATEEFQFYEEGKEYWRYRR
jgi:hypothetical protein